MTCCHLNEALHIQEVHRLISSAASDARHLKDHLAALKAEVVESEKLCQILRCALASVHC